MQALEIDFLPHGWGEPLSGIRLTRDTFFTPLRDRGTARPTMTFQQSDQHPAQIGFNVVELRQPDTLDFLDHMRPIDVIHARPARDAAQQVRLVL